MNKNLVNNIYMKCAGNFLNRQNMPFCKQKVHSVVNLFEIYHPRQKKKLPRSININNCDKLKQKLL